MTTGLPGLYDSDPVAVDRHGIDRGKDGYPTAPDG